MSADQSLDHTVTSHKECCYKMSVSLNALSVFFIGLFYFVESRVLDVTIIAGTKLIDLSKSLCVRLSNNEARQDNNIAKYHILLS